MKRILSIIILEIITTLQLELHGCSYPLGMTIGKIRDSQISSSSSYDLQSTGPQHARAHREYGSGAWCPKNQISPNSHEWLQISFNVDTVITGLETQGRYGNGLGKEYATSYRIKYWRPSLNAWASYKDDNELEVIEGNNDTHNAVRRNLSRAILVRRIRIEPISTTTRTVCMRIELFGCQIEDTLLSYDIDQSDRIMPMFADFSYDGTSESNDRLTGGIGKLYDSRLGQFDAFKNQQKWVGWIRRRTDYVTIVFNFCETRNFSGISIHTANEFRKNSRLFSSATIYFSENGKDFTGKNVNVEIGEDNISELPRWIRLPINYIIAKSIKLRLHFGANSNILLLSEVSFESNHTNLNTLDDSVMATDTISFFSMTHHEDSGINFVLASFFFALLLISTITVAMITRKREYRVKVSTPSPNTRKEILLTIDGDTIKHNISPSTYQMARDNIQNAMIENIPNIGDYAMPDVNICSDDTASTPLLYGFDGPYQTQLRSNPLSSIVQYSDYGEVYCTTIPEVAREKLLFIKNIGQGEFGEVDLCEIDKRKVAVKKLRGVSQADEYAFQREIRVLGSMKHSNVVEIVGVCTIQKPILCVMEYMENGDLKSYMTKTTGISTSHCISICTQIAAGLSYLESCNFVHRDIAARNCLVDGDGNVKVSDFGMARSLYSQEYYKVEGKFVLPIRWMSWEALLLGKFSTASDVWAFGVTMWEVFSLCLEKPYSNMGDEEVVENLQTVQSSGKLKNILERPALCPTNLYNEQILACFEKVPSSRPSFANLHLKLQTLIHTTG